MTYATVEDVQARTARELSAGEKELCGALLQDAAVIIDAAAKRAAADAKKVVSCRMVLRVLESGSDQGVPMGATQGSQSGLGYSQSWTFGAGANGELYLSKTEKQMLKVGNRIGSYSPAEELVP